MYFFLFLFFFEPGKRIIRRLCPQLTVSLSHLQQDGLLQHDHETLVLLVLLVIDDLHVQQLPGKGVKEQQREERMTGWKERWMNQLVSAHW